MVPNQITRFFFFFVKRKSDNRAHHKFLGSVTRLYRLVYSKLSNSSPIRREEGKKKNLACHAYIALRLQCMGVYIYVYRNPLLPIFFCS